jgi:hypothetical protein
MLPREARQRLDIFLKRLASVLCKIQLLYLGPLYLLNRVNVFLHSTREHILEYL